MKMFIGTFKRGNYKGIFPYCAISQGGSFPCLLKPQHSAPFPVPAKALGPLAAALGPLAKAFGQVQPATPLQKA